MITMYIGIFYTITLIIGKSATDDNFPSSSSRLNCEHGILLTKSVCIPNNYLNGEVPEIPTTVNSRIEINNIREVNDKEMRLTLEIYQESLWIDNRIKTSLLANGITVLNNNMINYLWKPDLWIKNLFDFKLHSVLEPTGGLIIMEKEFCENEDFSLKTVRKDFNVENCTRQGSNSNTLVMYNMEAQVELHCNFHFEHYPMDIQYCEFLMNTSYPYPDIVYLSFEQGQFGVTNNNLHTDEYLVEVVFQDKLNQSGVSITIKLERCLLPYIIRYYLPCIAIAVVSLINFCIPIGCIPARGTLLVTQFLTLTNILIAQQVK